MIDQPLTYFSQLDQSQVLSSLESSNKGLDDKEVKRRTLLYGNNTLIDIKKKSILGEFFDNFKSPLVIILMCVALISFLLGENFDALIVIAMVLMSVILDFTQEHRASQAAEKLKAKVAPVATVIRNNQTQEIPSSQITPGDILILNAGDLIPADCRIILANDLFINQSSLTGESFPVEKHSLALSIASSDISQLTNTIYAGTSVVTGSARAVVIKTGRHTEFGSIAEKLNEPDTENEFSRGVNQFGNLIFRIIIIFVVFIFCANVLIKHDLLQSLTFAIAIAVGLTPEFLPMIMTITMNRGAVIMAKKGVIVKKLTAIPTFGSMDILCTDKTGTLTEDHIHLVKYININGHESETVFEFAYLNSLFQTGITNPMDQAVIDYKPHNTDDYKKIDEIPFDFERKRMSVVVSTHNNHLLITKGAPEEIFKVSSNFIQDGHTKKFNSQAQTKLLTLYNDLSKEGFRVIAVAIKEIPTHKTTYSKTDENGMSVIGLIAFLDPAKQGVRDSIDALEAMGIEIKVITGDNELVTQKICHDADIVIKGLLLGHEIESLNDDQLYQKCTQTTIFARFSPSQKNRIISVLRAHGRVVGYMGDGINDAPSLKAADVGISVSNGVDVAKESADIILTNKSLQELKNGVIEGRKTFSNTMKYINMGLASNFGNMFSVLGAVLFLPFLPMLPIQILLNNFLYDFSQVTLPFDNVDEEFIQKPKRWSIKQIRNFMLIFGPISSIFDFLSFVLLYVLFQSSPAGFQTGWFIESLATQTLVIHIIRTRKLPFIKSNAHPYLWITTSLAVGVGWILALSPLGSYFGFTALPVNVVGLLITITLLYLVCVEIGKRIFYSLHLEGNM